VAIGPLSSINTCIISRLYTEREQRAIPIK